MRSVVSGVDNLQYAALPWRRANDGSLQILLITTKRTQRWIVPKGWPVAGLAPHRCAALEALEEAGVEGDVGRTPLGAFIYDKQRKAEGTLTCTVLVFPLEVTRQHSDWSERRLRETRWCATHDALERVGDAGLRTLLAKFAKAYDVRRPRRRRAAVAA